MKKLEVILHIGSHKTGSTALQNGLHYNNESLRNKGIYYGHYHNIMHHNLAFGLFKEALEEELIEYPRNYFYFSQIAENPKSVINRMNKDLQSSGNIQKVIISSEGLFGPGNFFAFHSGIQLTELQQQKVNEHVIVKLHGLLSDFDVKVVCYLRRQDLVLESFYNQYCKGPNPDDMSPLPTFEQYWSTRPVVMDYYQEMSTWASYFGASNVIIKPYERKQLPHGVVHDFYVSILGFSEDEYKQLETTAENEGNSRINRDVLEYKRLLQIHGLEGEFVKVSNVIGEVNRNQSFLHDDEREKILNGCAESNKRIAKEWLSREDGQLFLDYEMKKSAGYEGLTREKSIEISNKLVTLLVSEKQQLKDAIEHLNSQVVQLQDKQNATAAERDRLIQERNSTIIERDQLVAERDSLLQEKYAEMAEREKLQAEIDTIRTERDGLLAEKDKLLAEKDQLQTQYDSLGKVKDLLETEVTSLRQDKDVLTVERDAALIELRKIYVSKSWRLTKPLRSLGHTIRKIK